MTAAGNAGPDSRHIECGLEIPSEGYCDQPYVVPTDDGAWLCVMTTGTGAEGQPGQHVISIRSPDRGVTWEPPVALEPADGPEASYAVLLKVPSGRIYAFYNHNTDDVRRVKADDPPFRGGYCQRVDSLGHFVFRFSDDHGRTWSDQRYEVPQRLMAIDRENADGGELLYFWNVGKAFVHDGAGYVSLHKVGGFGDGFFTRSEGVLLRSANILTETDPAALQWETLPEGETGLRTPPGGGPVAEEHSYSVLSDGSLFAVYRSIDGHPVCAYSRDHGHTWSTPEYMRYSDGRRIKHPRAANFAWRCGNGRFLYWYHNHGGRFILEHPRRRTMAYQDRNPVWLCGGVEVDTPDGRRISWSQPEVVLYDDDPFIRMSYPDLIEADGEYYLTETQKDVARVHRVDPELLAGLWGQHHACQTPRQGLLLEQCGDGPRTVRMPALPALVQRGARGPFGSQDLRQGLAIELWLYFTTLPAGQIVLDTRSAEGQGICVRTVPGLALEVVLSDGRTRSAWECDPGLLAQHREQHVVISVDGGPHIISFVVDGQLNDGGDSRQFGWGRYNPQLQHANGAPRLHLGRAVRVVRLYERQLRTSEAVASFRAGSGA